MNTSTTASGLRVSDFEQIADGRQTRLSVLTNSNGVEVAITNFGAKIVSLLVPDRGGKRIDVVTGHQTLADYLSSEEPYFGAICGRYGNRIANGRFAIDGVVYDKLAINNGPNSLHGGLKGFNAVVWEMEPAADGLSVALRYTSPDGEEGFPGTLTVEVEYRLTHHNELIISYRATTDRPTVVNLTNHAYFNLSGAGDPSVYDHQLTINADYYLPTDPTAIPLGDPAPVADTPMDFRQPHAVGDRIDADFEQLRIGRGYDHTYILNKHSHDELAFCARCTSPKTGIVMDVYTTEPGVQLYTGNWMTGNFVGKNGQRYPMRSALCLETQHFPDSPNRPDYPSTLLRPGETYESKTIYTFATDDASRH